MRRENEQVEHDSGVVDKYRSHANGNGWVSKRAMVHPSAFVSENSYVESGVHVGTESWIGAGSWIDRDAVLGERVFIGQNVHVGQGTRLGDGAWVGSHSRIGAGVQLAAGVRLDRDSVIADATTVGPPPRVRLRPLVAPVPEAVPQPTDAAGQPARARNRYTRAA